MKQRVLLVGRWYDDTPIDSYRAALEPYYEVRVFDPHVLMPDAKRWIGLAGQWKLDSVVWRLSDAVLGRPAAHSERRLLRETQAFQPDIVLTDAVSTLHPDVVKGLHRASPNAAVLAPFNDAVSNLGRGYLFVAPYDALFLKDHFMVDKFRKKLGWKHLYYLPQACDRRLHRTVPLSEQDRQEYGCQLAVYGSSYIYRSQCLLPLQRYDVKVWGPAPPRWSDHPTHRMHAGKFVAGDEKCKAMLACQIALNNNHYAEVEGTNKRTFELAGIGAFQLTDTPALTDVFDSETEVASYDSAEELLEKIDYFLDHPQQRAEMAARAQRRAHAEHTYEHRWVAMLGALGIQPPADYPVQAAELRQLAR